MRLNKDNNFLTQSNRSNKRHDKLRQSINLSKKNISIELGQKLTKKQKQCILRYITNDYAFNLSNYLDKKVIKFSTQIGQQGSGWNLLHFSAKFNSTQCIQYLLKQQYKQQHQQYQKLKNSKTIQGYTSLMIAIINKSNQALEILLKLGISDLQQIDKQKMNAYDLAVNYKNQNAIQMLMKYENQFRKEIKVLMKNLQEPYLLIKKQQSCCQKCYLKILECFTFAFNLKNRNQNLNQNKIISLSRVSSLTFENQVDQVKISSLCHLQSQYEVVWKDIKSIIKNPSFPLFQSYNPFDISERNIVLKNNLIIFQCLSQHSWLVRKTTQIDKSKPHHFFINLYINFQLKKFNINNQIPFIKDREQPMFLENNNEMWPMLLQKGLAAAHNGYFDLDQVSPFLLVQELTGFPTFQLNLDNYQNSQIFKLLQELNRKGYFFLLEGIQGSNLSNQTSKKDCFSILNFYDKGDKKLILINCPFVNQAWKAKQKYQSYALKLIKSHINNHNQICVWIQEQKLKQYFSKVIISTTLPNYSRTSLKVKLKDYLFFSFKIKKQRQQNIIFQLINLQTKRAVQIKNVQIYGNQGIKKINCQKGIQKENYSIGVYNLQNNVGQYMCYIDLNCNQEDQFSEQTVPSTVSSFNFEKKYESHMLIMHSIDGIQPQYLDQTLGPVQFLQWLKTNIIKTWGSQNYKIQIICDFALIILLSSENVQSMYISLQIDRKDIIEGNFIQKDTIQLIKQKQQNSGGRNFYFFIIRNAFKYKQLNVNNKNINKKGINDNCKGQSIIADKLNFFVKK